MLQVPVISIFIFLAIFIPSGLIGYFRGWKSSLFIFIALFVFMGGFFCLAYFLYDSFWWEIFKGMFLEKAGGSLVSLEGFKDVSQMTVVGLIMMIATPISYGLALLVHWPFKQRLKRSLYPAVKQNPNAKEEFKLVENNYVIQRSAGAVISVATGLLVASTVTAGVQSIAEPTTKNTFLTSITKPLSRVYSMGHGGYDNAFQLAYEFLPETQRDEVKTAFNALANINSNSASTLEQDLAYFADPTNSDAIHKLAQSGDAFVAILKSLDANAGAELDLWNYTDDITSGTPTTGNGIDSSYFTTLETAILSIQLNIHLQTDTIDTIIEYIDSKLGEFSNSTWYANWNNAVQAIDAARQKLASLNSDLDVLEAHLAEATNKLNEFNAQLVARQAEKANLEGPATNPLSILWARQDLTAKTQAEQVAITNHTNYNNNMFLPAQQEDNIRMQARDREKDELDRLNGKLESKKTGPDGMKFLTDDLAYQLGVVSDASRRIADATTLIKNANDDIGRLTAELNTLTTVTKPANDAAVAQAQLEYDTAHQSLLTEMGKTTLIQNEITRLEGLIRGVDGQITQKQIDHQAAIDANDQTLAEQIQKDIDSLVLQKQSLNNDLGVQNGLLVTNSNEIQRLNGEVSAKNMALTNAKNEQSDTVQEISNKNTQIRNLTNSINNANLEIQSQQNTLDNAQARINDLNNNLIPAKQREIDAAQTAVNVQQGKYNAAESAYNTYHDGTFIPRQQELARLDGIKTQAGNDKVAAQTELDKRVERLRNLNAGIDNEQSIAWTHNQIVETQKDIDATNVNIANKKIEISDQEAKIDDLINNPLNGEVYLRNEMNRNEKIYSDNIDRYNKLIRQLLMS